MVLVFYVTGHGFGHATRSLAVIDELLRRRPDLRVIVRSSVPEWFLRRSGHPSIEIDPMQVDTGMVQVDSLVIDETATALTAAAFYQTFEERVAGEASYLREAKATVVVGDIPPLAFAAARAAGIPSVAISNFTWDWIYQYYPWFNRAAPGVIDVISRAYGMATHTLRLPFFGGFASMLETTRDIPLVARRSRLGRDGAREQLDLRSDRPVVLGSFGGHQTIIPYAAAAERHAITLVVTDYETTDDGSPWLRRFTAAELERRRIRYEDLVAAADIVVSKPGYGIVSECIANETALLHTWRGHFAENDVMVAAMPRALRCRFIDQAALRAGDWGDAINRLLAQPAPPERMATNGAEVAASHILSL